MKNIPVTPGRIDDKLYLYVPEMGLGIPVLQDEGHTEEWDDIMTRPMSPNEDLRFSSDPGWTMEEKIALMRIVYRLLAHGIRATGPRGFISECVYCGRDAPNILTPVCELCLK